jgi:Raf kinase inhibitor-like YbhB/YbcL family protein
MPWGQPNLVATNGSATNFTLTSPAFPAGAAIPVEDSCKGEDKSPPLAWSGAPAKTASFALIMDDPDAPGGIWVHWVLWNVPAAEHSLGEAVEKSEHLSDGAEQGQNSFHRLGYNGPCPPPGQIHHYYFRLYALDTKLDLAPGSSRGALDAAMKGHVLAETEYIGTFHR